MNFWTFLCKNDTFRKVNPRIVISRLLVTTKEPFQKILIPKALAVCDVQAESNEYREQYNRLANAKDW